MSALICSFCKRPAVVLVNTDIGEACWRCYPELTQKAPSDRDAWKAVGK